MPRLRQWSKQTYIYIYSIYIFFEKKNNSWWRWRKNWQRLQRLLSNIRKLVHCNFPTWPPATGSYYAESHLRPYREAFPHVPSNLSLYCTSLLDFIQKIWKIKSYRILMNSPSAWSVTTKIQHDLQKWHQLQETCHAETPLLSGFLRECDTANLILHAYRVSPNLTTWCSPTLSCIQLYQENVTITQGNNRVSVMLMFVKRVSSIIKGRPDILHRRWTRISGNTECTFNKTNYPLYRTHRFASIVKQSICMALFVCVRGNKPITPWCQPISPSVSYLPVQYNLQPPISSPRVLVWKSSPGRTKSSLSVALFAELLQATTSGARAHKNHVAAAGVSLRESQDTVLLGCAKQC